ncbi:MAG: response regulator transcription factor [Leptolyngbya sp. SIO1E4]|nr:response regulator transcription factor [Leptolyngbya sp. SIO1E4]
MTSANPIQVLLVDDEELVRYGLKAIINAEASIQVAGEASHGEEAISQAQHLQPDVVLMDINMPLMDGVVATGKIHHLLPHTKILILTTRDDDKCLVEAMQQGAAGFLLKNTPPQDLIQIIQSTHKGYMQFGPNIGQKLCQQLKPDVPPKKLDIPKEVTPREQEVIQLIAEGASNREIAQILHIKEKTVKNHVSNILSRVGLRDRTQLAIWANTAATKTPDTVAIPLLA